MAENHSSGKKEMKYWLNKDIIYSSRMNLYNDNINNLWIEIQSMLENEHNHNNKDILDTITQEKIDSWDSGGNTDLTNMATKNELNTKVDKVEGMGLSQESYTTNEKNKLARIETGANNYIHPSVHPASMITGLSNVAVSGSYNDLNNKPTIPSIEGLATKDELNTKVDKINGKGLSTNDLTNTLKSNYDTAYKHSQLAHFSGNYNDLTNKPTIPTVTNDLTNVLKSNYDTAYEHSQSNHAPSNAEANVQSDWNITDSTNDGFIKNKPTIPSIEGLATENFVTNKIAEAQLNGGDNKVDLNGLATKDELNTKVDKVEGKGLSTNDLTNTLKSNYNIAYTHSQSTHFSGNYNDLTNKPTLSDYVKTTDLPTKTSQLINDMGYLTSIPSEYITEVELNDKKYATLSDIPVVPTKVSQLTNDSGFITSIPSEYITETKLNARNYITSSDVPTKVSQLTNDSEFITSNELPDEYVLPNATSTSLGGVIVGEGLNINNGTISSNHNNDIINNLKISYDSSTGVINLTYNNNVISSITIEVSKNTYSIINNLNNATTNNVSGNIEEGSDYSATITPNTGYSISSIKVVMNGVDISSNTVSGNNISISNVTGNIIITVDTSVITYTVTNNLTNCTTNNSNDSITYNSSYSSTISVNSGYEMSSITVTMGGTNITSSVVNGNNISIPNVTGNVVITANATAIVIITYSITRNLTHCSINNSSNSIESGSTYVATVSPNSEYENISITVTMDSNDITSTAVSGNIINIPSVTGNIVITAIASKSSGTTTQEDTMEILTSASYIKMVEGGNKALYVKLSKQPTSDVTINIASSSQYLSSSVSSLTFTANNWYTSQMISLISNSDNNTTDDSFSLTLSSNGITSKRVTVYIVDETNSGFEVLYNNGTLINGAKLSLTNATDNDTYISTNMNADQVITISNYSLNLNKNDKVHLVVGLATTEPSSLYSIRSLQLGDGSANDISGSNMLSEEAINGALINGKVDTYWTMASALSDTNLTFTGYFSRVNIYKIYIERGN